MEEWSVLFQKIDTEQVKLGTDVSFTNLSPALHFKETLAISKSYSFSSLKNSNM